MTPHFTYKEAIKTATGLGNTPSPEVAVNIGVTAMRMETVRNILHNKPIIINSWFRSPLVNKAVGGSKTSDHMKGYAVDFKCPSYGSIYDVARRIHIQCVAPTYDPSMAEPFDKLKFDQLILEYGWIHISFAPAMRMQVLTKKSASAPYIVGLHK